MKRFLKTAGVILLILLGIEIINEINEYFQKPNNTSVSSGINRDSLLQIADSINKNMPMMINKDTRIDNVIGNSGLINYNITLINLTINEIDTNIEKSKMYNKLKNGICSDHQYDRFLKNNIKMKYSFHDKNGINLFSIAIGPKDCGY